MAILQTTGVSGSLSISSSNIPLSTSASLFNVNGYNGRLLDVVDNLSGSLFSVNSIAGLPIFEVFSDNRVIAGKYNANDLVISGSRVGIGTSSPGAKLDISGSSTTDYGQLYIRNNNVAYPAGINIFNTGARRGYIGWRGTTSTAPFNSYGMYFINYDNSNIIFGTNALERLRIDLNGNVGIGTTSPLTKLHVVGTEMSVTNGQGQDEGIFLIPENGSNANGGGRIFFKEADSNLYGFSLGYNGNSDNAILNWPTNTFCISRHNNDSTGIIELCIPRTGNVGIGTTSPAELLHLSSSVTTDLRIQGFTDSTVQFVGPDTHSYSMGLDVSDSDKFKISYANSKTPPSLGTNDRLVIDTSGKVGIGTSSPNSKLQIGNGTSNSYSTVAQLSGDSGGASILSALSLVNSRTAALSNGVSIDFHNANNYSPTGKIATVQAGVSTVDSEMRFYTYSSALGLRQKMVLNYLGQVGIGTSSPNAMLHVNSSGSLAPGSTVLNVDGTQGSLFSVVDNLTSSLMSVNDISGLPILEVFSDDTVVMGTFNANTLVVTGSKVGIGLAVPTAPLHVNDHAIIDGMTVGGGFNNLNTIVGNAVLYSNTTGVYNTAVGNKSLANNTTGQRNCSFGNLALYNNVTGQGNNAFGHYALLNNSVDHNSAFGIYTLYANYTGTHNSGFGAYALRNTNALNNSGFGFKTLYSNTTGQQNNAFGAYALQYNTTGDYNSAFGAFALTENVTGRFNAAFGHNALRENLTSSNSAFGVSALFSNTTGRENCVFGRAMFANTTGNFNCAFGNLTLNSNVSGAKNTTMGHSGLSSNIGNNNSAFGYKAGSTMTSGANNSFFGYNAQPSVTTVSNEITLGNSSVTTLRCQVTTITSLSDERDKTDINTLVNGLDIIDKVRPVTYKWDKREWYPNGVRDGSKTETSMRVGFIAQELKQMMTENGYEYLDLVYESNPDKLEATIGNLFVPLIRAVQELHEKVKILEAKIKY